MSGQVYANGREVSAKKDSNRSIAAMPDVCLSPPSPPAGPLPIPYPNFSQASDTSSGTKTVTISGKEVGKKNASNYKKSRGDISATRSFGMGVVTHTLEGKTEHAAWSFDVKFEGKNAIRHLDLTTHNHASNPMNSGSTTVDNAKFAPASPGDEDCKKMAERESDARTSPNAPPEVALPKTTHSVGHFTAPEGGKSNMIACSKAVDFVKNPAYSEGVGKSSVNTFQRKNMKEPRPAEAQSNLCGGYQHKSENNCSKSAHTEARMIEEIFKNVSPVNGSMGTLRMKIRWDQGGGKVSDRPCPNCEELICAAEACGLRIEICVGNQPKTMEDLGNDCDQINADRKGWWAKKQAK